MKVTIIRLFFIAFSAFHLIDVVTSAPMEENHQKTPLEREMRERRVKCASQDWLGFIHVLDDHRLKGVQYRTLPYLIPLYAITHRPENCTDIFYYKPEDLLLKDWEQNEQQKLECIRNLGNKKYRHKSTHGEKSLPGIEQEGGHVVSEGNYDSVSAEHYDYYSENSEYTCTFLHSLNNITRIDFFSEMFGLICINDYNGLGTCSPDNNDQMDCKALPCDDDKNVCCLKKFVQKYLSSFERFHGMLSTPERNNSAEDALGIYPLFLFPDCTGSAVNHTLS